MSRNSSDAVLSRRVYGSVATPVRGEAGVSKDMAAGGKKEEVVSSRLTWNVAGEGVYLVIVVELL